MSKPDGHHVATACPLDCPDSCSLSVTLTDGRVSALDGGPGNPATGGFICGKVRRFGERVYGPDRLLRPGLRRAHADDSALPAGQRLPHHEPRLCASRR